MKRNVLACALVGFALACGPPAPSEGTRGSSSADAGVGDAGVSDAGGAAPDAGAVQETGLVGTWVYENPYSPQSYALAFRADGQMLELEFRAGCSADTSAPYVVEGDTLRVGGEVMGTLTFESNDRLVITPPGAAPKVFERWQVPCHTIPVAWSAKGEWEFVDEVNSGPKGFVITAYGEFFRLKRSRYCLPYERHPYLLVGREEATNLIVLDPGEDDVERIAYEIDGDQLVLGEGANARTLRRVDNGCIRRLRLGSGLARGVSGTWGNRSMPGGQWFILHFDAGAAEVKISSNGQSCALRDTFAARSYDGQRHNIVWIDFPDNYAGMPQPGPTFFEWVQDHRYSLTLFPIYPEEPPEDGRVINLSEPPCGM